MKRRLVNRIIGILLLTALFLCLASTVKADLPPSQPAPEVHWMLILRTDYGWMSLDVTHPTFDTPDERPIPLERSFRPETGALQRSLKK